MVYYQGYTSGASSAKNNQALFLVAPLLDENNPPAGSSHAHYGNKVWDLSYNNYQSAKMSYYIMTSDPNNTTVTQNGSTVALNSWGATSSFSKNVNGVLYTMYENRADATNFRLQFICRNLMVSQYMMAYSMMIVFGI